MLMDLCLIISDSFTIFSGLFFWRALFSFREDYDNKILINKPQRRAYESLQLDNHNPQLLILSKNWWSLLVLSKTSSVIINLFLIDKLIRLEWSLQAVFKENQPSHLQFSPRSIQSNLPKVRTTDSPTSKTSHLNHFPFPIIFARKGSDRLQRWVILWTLKDLNPLTELYLGSTTKTFSQKIVIGSRKIPSFWLAWTAKTSPRQKRTTS